MSNRPTQLLGDTPLTRAEELFVRQVSARYMGMEDWQIAYIVRKMLDYLEMKKCRR